MKLSKGRRKASHTFAQSAVATTLLFSQTLLFGCVSANNGGSVVVDKQTEINVPVNIPEIEGLK